MKREDLISLKNLAVNEATKEAHKIEQPKPPTMNQDKLSARQLFEDEYGDVTELNKDHVIGFAEAYAESLVKEKVERACKEQREICASVLSEYYASEHPEYIKVINAPPPKI